jgi:hypothetical protein
VAVQNTKRLRTQDRKKLANSCFASAGVANKKHRLARSYAA